MFTLRPLHGPQDLPHLQAIDAACAERGEFSSAGTDQGQIHLEGADSADWFIAEQEGQVVGYGHASLSWREKDGTWVCLHLGRVHPDFRRKGIGTALLQRLEQRCHEKAAAAGQLEHLELAANAAETERDATRFLHRNGYFVAFTMLDLHRSLATNLPDIPTLPDGYELRPMRPEHHLAVWQSISYAYDARDLNRLRFGEEPQNSQYDYYFSREPDLTFVAWRENIVAGQVIATIHPDTTGGAGRGELLEVSVGPRHQRQGLARTLMLHALHALRERGVHDVWVGTRLENPSAAWQQYEKLGFQIRHRFPRWRKART